jgi:predicted RecB family nuclease
MVSSAIGANVMGTPLTEIKGIGAATAGAMEAQGIHNVEDLAAASIEQITRTKGFGDVRAARAKAAAVELLQARRGAAKEPATPAPAATKEKKPEKKHKEDKRKKGKKEEKKDKKKSGKTHEKGKGKKKGKKKGKA